ncbi:MAG: type II toxin-antitoxin system HipA family toxin [Jatrophihabitans sp.]|uniref:type II toxin-antitoxin system HipA family toxin n=1 Tax=Jatrophihabitans sp. TaxID=1932789 RepID=UPI003F7F7143
MAPREPLAVWLYGTRIATLAETRDGRLQLRWTDDAYDRWGDGSRVMSHLLPLSVPTRTPHAARVKVFLDGLLPEGHARVNHAMEAGLRPEDTFGLIARYGRDTAGALVFQPADEPSPLRVGSYRALDEREVAQRLRDAHRHAPGHGTDAGRDSSMLAGLQPKITLHRADDGAWQACVDGAPSTWIVKVAQAADGPSGDVVDTEVFSLDLARRAGMAAAHAQLHVFDGVRAIAVRRYDRIQAPDGLRRVHQEDLAQALGLNTDDPLRKFQRGNTIPSLRAAAEVLRRGGSEPDDLVRLTTLNYVLGNIDAHAKNISFLRHDDGTATLAPAYDIAMHLHHDDEQHRSALDINGKVDYADITPDDLVSEARSWGMPLRRAQRTVDDTVEALRAALGTIDVSEHPGVSERAVSTVVSRLPRS